MSKRALYSDVAEVMIPTWDLDNLMAWDRAPGELWVRKNGREPFRAWVEKVTDTDGSEAVYFYRAKGDA